MAMQQVYKGVRFEDVEDSREGSVAWGKQTRKPWAMEENVVLGQVQSNRNKHGALSRETHGITEQSNFQESCFLFRVFSTLDGSSRLR